MSFPPVGVELLLGVPGTVLATQRALVLSLNTY